MANVSINLDANLFAQLEQESSRLTAQVATLESQEEKIAHQLNPAKKLIFDPSDENLPQQLHKLMQKINTWVELYKTLKTSNIEEMEKTLVECENSYANLAQELGRLEAKVQRQGENNLKMTPIKKDLQDCSVLLQQLTPKKVDGAILSSPQSDS